MPTNFTDFVVDDQGDGAWSGRAGCRGWNAARMGAFDKVLFTDNSTVNLTTN